MVETWACPNICCTVPRSIPLSNKWVAVVLRRSCGLNEGIPAWLARLFQTSSDNIRQVDSRVYEDVSLGSPPSATNLLREFADELEWEVLRKKSPRANRLRNRRKLKSLEQQLNADFGQYVKSEQFAIGAEALRTFLPHVCFGEVPVASIRCFAALKYSRSISTPTNFRPRSSAATAVDPTPMKGPASNQAANRLATADYTC